MQKVYHPIEGWQLFICMTMADHSEFTKPVRPLTAYHLFFQLERAAILQSTDTPSINDTEIENEHVLGQDIDPSMPARYRNIKLSPTWYNSSSGKRTRTKESDQKRKHRKSHGKISFQELSHRIAKKWKTLEETDNETKLYCAKIAKRELELYKEKMEMYKASLSACRKRSIVQAFGNTLNGFPYAGSSFTSARSYTSSITPISATYPALSINQVSGSSHVKSPGVVSATLNEASNIQVNSEFIPSWMETSKLHIAGCDSNSDSNQSEVSSSQLDIGNVSNDAEFSFIPIPPSLLDREDSFLQSCEKRGSYSAEPRKSPPINSLSLCDESNDAAYNSVVFGSNMRDLDVRLDEASNASKKRSASDSSKSDTSPLQLCESLLQLDYKFTEDDAEMLLKALF